MRQNETLMIMFPDFSRQTFKTIEAAAAFQVLTMSDLTEAQIDEALQEMHEVLRSREEKSAATES